MQSSAAVAIRGLVMLACVVAIPVLAISGTSWSEVLKKFQDLHWPAIFRPAGRRLDGGAERGPTHRRRTARLPGRQPPLLGPRRRAAWTTVCTNWGPIAAVGGHRLMS